MLVLSRYLGERIIIGDGENKVIVELVSIDRGKIKMGFICPRTTKILRSELVDFDANPENSKSDR